MFVPSGFMPRYQSISLLAVIAALLLSSCAHRQRACVPPEMTRAGRLVDLSAPAGEDHAVEQKTVAELLRLNHADDPAVAPVGRQYQILALSGGAV